MGRQGAAAGEMTVETSCGADHRFLWSASQAQTGISTNPIQGGPQSTMACSTLPLWSLALALFLTPLHAADPYLFAYFIEPAKTGVYFALSEDGYRQAQGQPDLPLLHQGFRELHPAGDFLRSWV